MYSGSSVKDFTIGPATIPNTDVQTESILHPLNPVKHLAYLCQFSQDDFTVVRPLNRANLECWSNGKKIDEISNHDLIVTIEIIKDKIILGIDIDVDVRLIRLRTKLILESKNMQCDIGTISEIHRFTKNIPYPTKSPIKQLSQYTLFFKNFVKENQVAFAKSKFAPAPLFYFHEQQGEKARSSNGELLTGQQQYENANGHTFVGIFDKGIPISGKISLFDGTLIEGTLNGFQGSLHGSGTLVQKTNVLLNKYVYEFPYDSFDWLKFIFGWLFMGKNERKEVGLSVGKNIGVSYKGVFENGILVNGIISWIDGDWFESNAAGFISLTGHGRLTLSRGEIFKGFFRKGILREGIATFANGDYFSGEFRKSGLTGKGRFTFMDGCIAHGIFKDGNFVKGTIEGKNTCLDGSNAFDQPASLDWWLFDETHIRLEGVFENRKLIQGKKIWSYQTPSSFLRGTFSGGVPLVCWIKGTFEGEGIQINQAGVIIAGIFQNGKLSREKPSRTDGIHIQAGNPIDATMNAVFLNSGEEARWFFGVPTPD